MPSPSDRKRLRVSFVELPFGPVAWPAIGPSLLTSRLEEAGHHACVVYANMDLLTELGAPSRETVAAYHAVADAFDVHAGEWVFAAAAFPGVDLRVRDTEYLARLVDASPLYRDLVPRLRELRALALGFLDRTARRVLATQPDVVGLGTSFSQTNAALALAHRLRTVVPDLPVVVGGCAAADEMGVALLHVTDDVDAVTLGEADDLVVDLVETLAARDSARLITLPGVAARVSGGVVTGPPKSRIRDVDALPVPQYCDYFAALPASLADLLPFYLPVEASRGCWWGAKSHCTFCGLNPTRMAFHAKKADRFLAEVATLRDRHKPRRFMAVDNIMPHQYHSTVVPHLATASGKAEFFFEVKANFRREQMQGLAAANVLQIQPGVESLSSPVLRLMRKGTTAIANAYTLRLVQECGLRAHWSVLYGFGGETLEQYLISAQLAGRIVHLPPPMGAFPVEVERFAPMFRQPAKHGLTRLRPSSWYRHCFPVSDAVLADLAYRFDADYLDRPVDLTNEIRSLMESVVSEWRARYAEGRWRLEVAHHEPDTGELTVRRWAGDAQTTYLLDRRSTRLCLAFARPRGVAAVVPGLQRHPGEEPYRDPRFLKRCPPAATPGHREVVLRGDWDVVAYDELLRHGLIVEEEGLAVSVVCGLPTAPDDTDEDLTVRALHPDLESATTYLRLATT